MKRLFTIDIKTGEQSFSEGVQTHAVDSLEEGKVLYFPSLPFSLIEEELKFLNPKKVDPKTKNISYDLRTDKIGGAICSEDERPILSNFLKRYALFSRKLLERLIPHYVPTLIQGKTSFRPVEIEGRKSSYRKDDTRLHVDSFPSNPVKGQRILRVFTNINPNGKARVWRLGEPFENVVSHMVPKVSQPIPGISYLLKLLKITKDYRTPYDHYMLGMHDKMKGDNHYQQTVSQEEVHFPAGSTWIVYTDQVSHAAMAGQHVLEQTFYLPVSGLKNVETAPLKVLEKHFNKKLI